MPSRRRLAEHPAGRRSRRPAVWRHALVAAALLLSLLSACKFDGAYDLPLPGAPVSASDGFKITAEFEDILNVVPKSPVMVDDVTVGEVTDVERVGWHAEITMLVRKDVNLPDNAIAEIKQVSLLGEKYVSLEPPPTGTAPVGRLGAGDNIPLDRTGRNPEVEEVLGALSFLLSGGGVAQLGTITKELNKAMDGREDRLCALLGNLTDVVGQLDQQKGDIIRAMQSVNDLTATLNTEKQTVQGALDATGPAVKVLADQHDQLIAMLQSLDRLGVVGTHVIRASKANLLSSLDHLQPVLSKLRAAGSKLAPGLNLLISFPFPKEASEIVRGDYANTSIRADISLENFLPPGVTLPDLPVPTVPVPIPDPPNPGQVLTDVQACLASANIASVSCQKVLTDVNLLSQLKAECQKPKWQGNPVCQTINALPDLPLDQLPGVLGNLLTPRSLASSLSSSRPVSSGTTSTLYGGSS